MFSADVPLPLGCRPSALGKVAQAALLRRMGPFAATAFAGARTRLRRSDLLHRVLLTLH